ncbi:MAG: hypothetical protein HYV63_30400 [Candidatus Schekmanbacteria bacterium]|nr:hypothetical protein [Candidatus Schekmanbacteria bacterium]
MVKIKKRTSRPGKIKGAIRALKAARLDRDTVRVGLHILGESSATPGTQDGVARGRSTVEAIAAATELTVEKVAKSLLALQKIGLIAMPGNSGGAAAPPEAVAFDLPTSSPDDQDGEGPEPRADTGATPPSNGAQSA